MQSAAAGSKLPVPARKKKVTVPKEFSFATSARAHRTAAPLDHSTGSSSVHPVSSVPPKPAMKTHLLPSGMVGGGKHFDDYLSLRRPPETISKSAKALQTTDRRPFGDATNRKPLFQSDAKPVGGGVDHHPSNSNSQPAARLSRQHGIVFEADPSALGDILSGRGVSEMSINQHAASRMTAGNFNLNNMPRKSLGAPIRRLRPAAGTGPSVEELRRRSVFVGGAQRTNQPLGRPSVVAARNVLSQRNYRMDEPHGEYENDEIHKVLDDNQSAIASENFNSTQKQQQQQQEEDYYLPPTNSMSSQSVSNSTQPMSKLEKSMNGYFARLQHQHQPQHNPTSSHLPTGPNISAPPTPAAKRDALITRAGLAMIELNNTPRSQRSQAAFASSKIESTAKAWPEGKSAMESYLRSLPPLPDSPAIPPPPSPLAVAASFGIMATAGQPELSAQTPASPAIVRDLSNIEIPPPPPPLLMSDFDSAQSTLQPTDGGVAEEDDTCALFFSTAPNSGNAFDPLNLQQKQKQVHVQMQTHQLPINSVTPKQQRTEISDSYGLDTPTSEERRNIMLELERLNELEAQILAEMNAELVGNQKTQSTQERRFFSLEDIGRI